LQRRMHDWMYFAEPEATLDGRGIECARGKVIGTAVSAPHWPPCGDPDEIELGTCQAAGRKVSWLHTSLSPATRASISASLCSGVGVSRRRSVPRGTVG
jgi:hypothetical protein